VLQSAIPALEVVLPIDRRAVGVPSPDPVRDAQGNVVDDRHFADIHERTAAEQALRRSEERLARILESAWMRLLR